MGVEFDTLGIQNFYFDVSDIGGYPWKLFKENLHWRVLSDLLSCNAG